MKKFLLCLVAVGCLAYAQVGGKLPGRKVYQPVPPPVVQTYAATPEGGFGTKLKRYAVNRGWDIVDVVREGIDFVGGVFTFDPAGDDFKSQ